MEFCREVAACLKKVELGRLALVSELRFLIGIDGENCMQNLIYEDFYSQVLGGGILI